MKENFIHVCFVIDESGSMTGSEQDVIGGFKKVIDEQKANENGSCAVSLFKFQTNVTKCYVGKDVNSVAYLETGTYNLARWCEGTTIKALSGINTLSDISALYTDSNDNIYSPGGCTSLFDGVGQAIDSIGKWLNDMDESERPEKNLIVIMTDGGENSSCQYSGSQVKEMIKHQEDKYNWSFIYMGNDLTDSRDADTLQIKTRSFSSKANYAKNYDVVNSYLTTYRATAGDALSKAIVAENAATTQCLDMTEAYASERGIDANKLLNNQKTD